MYFFVRIAVIRHSCNFRYLEVLTFGCKSRRKGEKRQYYEDMMLNEDSDAALLRLLECFMESAPQLTLQLYILCTFGVDNNELLSKNIFYICYTSIKNLGPCYFTSIFCSLLFQMRNYWSILK